MKSAQKVQTAPPAAAAEAMEKRIADLEAQVEALQRQAARQAVSQRRRVRKNGPLLWQQWMPKFLQVLEASGNASAAIAAVDPCRDTVYQHKARCPEFGAAWEAVLDRLRAGGSRG